MHINELNGATGPGTYAKLVPTETTKTRIAAVLDQLCIDATKPDKLHTTVIYSRVHCPYAATMKPMVPITATAKGFALFGNDPESKCLVLLLDCPEAEFLHGMCRLHGATHDYDKYEPHITLSYGYTRPYPPNEDLLQYFDHIEFDRFEVEPLDEDWKDK